MRIAAVEAGEMAGIVVGITSSAGQIPGATELASRAHRTRRWTPWSAILFNVIFASFIPCSAISVLPGICMWPSEEGRPLHPKGWGKRTL